MRTLSEYNRIILQDKKRLNSQRAGVLCDKCRDAEMEYENFTRMIIRRPPVIKVTCPSCGYKGVKYV